jgi:hypothetical protein
LHSCEDRAANTTYDAEREELLIISFHERKRDSRKGGSKSGDSPKQGKNEPGDRHSNREASRSIVHGAA